MSLTQLDNGNKIVSASSDETIRIWNTNTGDTLNVIKSENDCLLTVNHIADSNIIASGGKDKKIKIWNLNEGKCVS